MTISCSALSPVLPAAAVLRRHLLTVSGQVSSELRNYGGRVRAEAGQSQ